MQPVSSVGYQALQRRLDDLQAENERLRRQLDEAIHAGKRQADPFAKGSPTSQPRRRGKLFRYGKPAGTIRRFVNPSPRYGHGLRVRV